MTLGEAVAAVGLLYAPDPGSRVVSTVGGNVATCAGGLRGLKYGVTRNYVLGLEAVLPTGEVIRTGGRLWKDVAGYDLTRLLTGSEGTLAVITEVTVALLPAPASGNTGVAYFTSLADAGRAVAAVIAGGLVPATLEFLDRQCIVAVEEYAGLGLRTDAGALLMFGDDGHPDSVERSMARMGEACVEAGALEVTTAKEVAEAEALLAARRCALPALSRLGSVTMLEDASVPRPRIAEMVERIDRIAEKHDVLIPTFGHAGDGNLHPTVVLPSADDADVVSRAGHAIGDMFAAALELDGTITGEHGVGAAKLPYLSARLGEDQLALLRRIKAAFDPAGILNPGKLGS
jgi:glycolate oxidase